jgi:5-formyltetrahydrofolate cyclo-ligase
MTNILKTKQELRLEMRRLLKRLSPNARMAAGIKVKAHVETWLNKFFPQKNLKVALFESMADEIDTCPLNNLFIKLNAVRTIPHINNDNYLSFIKFDHFAFDKNNSPINSSIEPAALNFMFIPGLAFDQLGHRLGRGKGYYDRVLCQFSCANKRRPCFIGLAMDEQVIPLVPVERHDIFMDFLCTPSLGMHQIK